MAVTKNPLDIMAPVDIVSAPPSREQTQGTLQAAASVTPSAPRPPPLWQIHALPAPIRTYPLPTFYPSNPLSLFHVLYTWISQTVSPPPKEPSTIHEGTWSARTRSVHITDQKSIRALWEQGFYGKGTFSRSEPNWLKKQQARMTPQHVAEVFTAKRREERKQMKWDRARKEQEGIQRTKFEEARIAPVGPKELLALPNSHDDLRQLIMRIGVQNGAVLKPLINGGAHVDGNNSSKGPSTVVPSDGSLRKPEVAALVEDSVASSAITSSPVSGYVGRPQTPKKRVSSSPVKRRKSVRFSPDVNTTTFQCSDPPSPSLCLPTNGHAKLGDVIAATVMNGAAAASPLSQDPEDLSFGAFEPEEDEVPPWKIVDKEHLQLTAEEAFFLAFGLGALSVKDESSGRRLPTQELFTLCRQYSHFPPRFAGLELDDPFLVHYAVYHHYRSLGWVPRSGIKFGVDWLLYQRGPAFSHAEFAIVVLPSYSDAHWKCRGRVASQVSWQSFFTTSRVQAKAMKTLVLVYVDIPPPMDGDETDASAILKRYKIREVMTRRFSLNRNRD